eukprot:CAMPEP_0117072638 /NCGR_PEP_ID=MMETSP0472-20121206/51132_1 /TAXON_ID=693140 ORGANISM="Tiarina fusus, Strain LIS" /NCGR_SAMPLE_ID=MMETSP0472 /ASSEMBLY_ACC=CAM_ASM_000603 /LENGTH=173 /DNA_ID=CAMNT_0004796835 /DNA_START=82 /DNA_END=603 /DNA_ORIENTATION=-
MKLYIALLLATLIPTAPAFQPTASGIAKVETAVSATRRDTLGLIGTTLCFPIAARAFSQQLPDNAYEPQQQRTDGKFDLNAAVVGDYKVLRGMFPTAAGKIASHGPYQSVKDIYSIPGLTAHDIELFKKYEKEFTIHPRKIQVAACSMRESMPAFPPRDCDIVSRPANWIQSE